MLETAENAENAEEIEQKPHARKRKKDPAAQAPGPQHEQREELFLATLKELPADTLVYIYRIEPVIDRKLSNPENPNNIDKVSAEAFCREYLREHHGYGCYVAQIGATNQRQKFRIYDGDLLAERPKLDMREVIPNVEPNRWYIENWTRRGWYTPATGEKEKNNAMSDTLAKMFLEELRQMRQEKAAVPTGPTPMESALQSMMQFQQAQAATQNAFLTQQLKAAEDRANRLEERIEALSAQRTNPTDIVGQATELIRATDALRPPSAASSEVDTLTGALVNVLNYAAPHVPGVLARWSAPAPQPAAHYPQPAPAGIAADPGALPNTPAAEEEEPEDEMTMQERMKAQGLLIRAVNVFFTGGAGAQFVASLTEEEKAFVQSIIEGATVEAIAQHLTEYGNWQGHIQQYGQPARPLEPFVVEIQAALQVPAPAAKKTAKDKAKAKAKGK